MMLTPEEIKTVKDNARNIRFKVGSSWGAPIGYKGRL